MVLPDRVKGSPSHVDKTGGVTERKMRDQASFTIGNLYFPRLLGSEYFWHISFNSGATPSESHISLIDTSLLFGPSNFL
ncbi:MAG: hypothetical protein ACTSU2_02815, partial [Promethearchaeota archaeon]